MSEPRAHAFDESLISGYLDGALTQQERQRVELHLAACGACTELFDELCELRSAARDTAFRIPSDEQWREAPRGPASRSLRWAGWVMLLAWAAGSGAFGLWQLAASSGPLWEKLAVFGGLSGGGLLLLSVLLDRLHALEGDRYRRVLK